MKLAYLIACTMLIGVELQKEFDVRLHQISHFPGLKLINKFGQLKVVTAVDDDHQSGKSARLSTYN